jgi:CheY-like chemotaxis protein
MASRQPVLLVSPFSDERDMYATYMRARGIEVAVCKDPVAALTFARQQSVRAVVARILQAGSADGVTLTRALKGDERTRRIPVIIITTQPDKGIQAEAESAGCDRFLLLPCLPEQLVAEIRRIT